MQLLLLTKNDCELCELAEATHSQLLAEYSDPIDSNLSRFARVDIDACEWLGERYGWSIPVFVKIDLQRCLDSLFLSGHSISDYPAWLSETGTRKVSGLLQEQLKLALVDPSGEAGSTKSHASNPHVPEDRLSIELYWPFTKAQLRKFLFV